MSMDSFASFRRNVDGQRRNGRAPANDALPIMEHHSVCNVAHTADSRNVFSTHEPEAAHLAPIQQVVNSLCWGAHATVYRLAVDVVPGAGHTPITVILPILAIITERSVARSVPDKLGPFDTSLGLGSNEHDICGCVALDRNPAVLQHGDLDVHHITPLGVQQPTAEPSGPPW